MPRKGSDQYVTHRLELGVWERKQIEKQLIPKQIESTAKAAGYVAAGGAMALAAYGLFWALDALYGIVDKAANSPVGEAAVKGPLWILLDGLSGKF